MAAGLLSGDAFKSGLAAFSLGGLVLFAIVPLPAVLIDAMVTLSLLSGFALLVLVMMAGRAADLPSFPALLLMTTILRVACSVAATRAILAEGYAGKVVHAVGSVVLSGSIGAGLVIYAAVAIVQFLVVAKGGERIAEVAARFALDAMPARQMSIEADLKAGDIDAVTARRLREDLSRENRLMGALDGSMRFVKGDNIASMVLLVINLVAGMSIGVWQKGLSIGQAASQYSILSVGDGLVAQAPSMLSAVAAGLLASHAGNSQLGMGAQIAREIAHSRTALSFVGLGSFALAAVPRFPAVPFVLAGLACFIVSLRKNQAGSDAGAQSATAGSLAGDQVEVRAEPVLPQVEDGSAIQLAIHPDDAPVLAAMSLPKALEHASARLTRDAGCPFPAPGFRLGAENIMGRIELELDGVAVTSFAIDGNPDALAHAVMQRIGQYGHELIDLDAAAKWLEHHKSRWPKLIEKIENFDMNFFTAVLKRPVRERVPLAYPRALFEELGHAAGEVDPEAAIISERVRVRLRRQYVRWLASYAPPGPVLTLDEDAFCGIDISGVSADIDGFFAADELHCDALEGVVAKIENGDDWGLIVVPDRYRVLVSDSAYRNKSSDLIVLSSSEYADFRQVYR